MDRRKQVLIKALRDRDEHIRSAAAGALERLEIRLRLPAFEKLVESGDKIEKLRAIYAVSGLRGEQVLNLLVKATKDPVEDVRAAALRSLGRIGDKRVLPAVVESLKDRSPVVVRVAIDALANLWDQRLLGPLMQMLKSKDHGVVERALDVIGRSGDKRAENAMIYFAVKGNRTMRMLAIKALGVMET